MNHINTVSEAIEQITEENLKARRRSHAAKAHASLIQAAEEIARLRAALKPFAALARTYKVETGELNKADDRPLFGLNDAKVTVGDMRAAIKVLEEP